VRSTPPLNEEGQANEGRGDNPQRLPREETSIGLCTRALERSLSFDMRRLSAFRNLGQAVDRNRPCYQPRLCKSLKLGEQETRRPGLLGVNRDNFQIPPTASNALCVPRPGC
jgi:hypothetical protein